MSDVNDVFYPLNRSRTHLTRLNTKSVDHLKLGKPNHGYCEGCESYQLAPKVRKKGWRCAKCASNKKTP